MALEWTAALDLDATAVSFTELARGLDEDAGVLIEDAATSALLAQLRRAELDLEPNALDILVRDGSGRHLQLLVRAEPPAVVTDVLPSVVGPAG